MAILNEDRIQQLSLRESYILSSEAMITVPASRKYTPIDTSSSPPSSLGHLDKLPMELFYMVLDQLDIQSLVHLAAASHRGREVVHSVGALRDLIEHAFPTLVALSRTQLLQWHPVSILYHALRSTSCISCREFGPFLYLPTCERCCYWCLCKNHSLWLLPVSKARRIFGLNPEDMQDVPVLRAIPGSYHVRRINTCKTRHALVCVKTVKQLALKIHGSQSALDRIDSGNWRLQNDKSLVRETRSAPLEPLECNPSRLPSKGGADDYFAGMGSIRFPALMAPEGRVENGYWCKGCQLVYDRYRRTPGLIGQLSRLFRSPITSRLLDGMARRARARVEFVEHVKICLGVRLFLTSETVN